MPGRPVTDADRERVRQLHADGLSCARIAKGLALSFDRSKTRAQVDDAKARRTTLGRSSAGARKAPAPGHTRRTTDRCVHEPDRRVDRPPDPGVLNVANPDGSMPALVTDFLRP